MIEIYLKKLSDGGYYLVNKNGNAVHLNGELAYHPVFYTEEQAKSLPYPVYSKASVS